MPCAEKKGSTRLKKLTAQDVFRKMKLAEDLFNFSYQVKSHQIKKAHPDWSEESVHKKTLELIDKGCS